MTEEPESTVHVNERGRAYDPNVDDKTCSYALWIHVAALIAQIATVSSGGIAFFIPCLVAALMWQIRKDDPYIDDHGREAVNFQLSLIFLGLILIPISIVTCGVGAVLYVGLPILTIIGGVMAAMAAYRGEYFRYPMTWRPFKSQAERDEAAEEAAASA